MYLDNCIKEMKNSPNLSLELVMHLCGLWSNHINLSVGYYHQIAILASFVGNHDGDNIHNHDGDNIHSNYPLIEVCLSSITVI